MILYSDRIQLPTIEYIHKHKGHQYSDDILCFDIETTSLFDIEGEFKPYDYTRPKEYYIGREKKALPYIWQFGYNEKVYYSNDFHKFGDVLERIARPDVEQFIFCHNLAYEFNYLVGLFKKRGWTLSGVIARGIRKVIQFHIDELNITFRCSYALTGMSLASAGENFGCKHGKMVGDLDYRKPRSPLSVPYMTKEELTYCEMDIRVMYEFLSVYKERYKHVRSIPLTQTGEVRKEMNSHVTYWYHRDVWSRVPSSLIYMKLMSAFMGGVTHANYIHVGKVREVMSYDFASSYPFRMVTCKFPIGKWFEITEKEIDHYKKDYAILYHVKLRNFKSKFYNHYIPSSKAIDKVGCRFDNGRIIKGIMCELTITDVDFEIIKKMYEIETIEVLDVHACPKSYLPKEVIEFILEMYGRKTQLKGVIGHEELYSRAKACINSLY